MKLKRFAWRSKQNKPKKATEADSEKALAEEPSTAQKATEREGEPAEDAPFDEPVPVPRSISFSQHSSDAKDGLIDSDNYTEDETSKNGEEDVEPKEGGLSSIFPKLALCGTACMSGKTMLSDLNKTVSAAFHVRDEDGEEDGDGTLTSDKENDMTLLSEEDETAVDDEADTLQGTIENHDEQSLKEGSKIPPAQEVAEESLAAPAATETAPEGEADADVAPAVTNERALASARPGMFGCLFGLFRRKKKNVGTQAMPSNNSQHKGGGLWSHFHKKAGEDEADLVRYMSHKERVERGFEVLYDDYDGYRQKQGETPFPDYKYQPPTPKASNDADDVPTDLEQEDEQQQEEERDNLAEATEDREPTTTEVLEETRDVVGVDQVDEPTESPKQEQTLSPIGSQVSAQSTKSKTRFSLFGRKKAVPVASTSAELEDVSPSKEPVSPSADIVGPPMGSALRATSE